MNAKQAKRLRRLLRKQLKAVGNEARTEHDGKTWDIHIVPSFSRHGSVTVGKGTEDEKVYDDAAIQVRLTPTCPRALYRRIKQRVQANRKTG